MKTAVIKVGSVEFTESDLEKIYEEKKYVVTYSGVYAIHYSIAQKRHYGIKILYCKGMAMRGRFYIMTAEEINHIIGIKVLNEEQELAK